LEIYNASTDAWVTGTHKHIFRGCGEQASVICSVFDAVSRSTSNDCRDVDADVSVPHGRGFHCKLHVRGRWLATYCDSCGRPIGDVRDSLGLLAYRRAFAFGFCVYVVAQCSMSLGAEVQPSLGGAGLGSGYGVRRTGQDGMERGRPTEVFARTESVPSLQVRLPQASEMQSRSPQ
jgi:hypothetical protein